jgi:protein gp37
MAQHTDIGWADSSVNGEMGCDGCELWNPATGVRYCYAGRLTERRTQDGPQQGWPKAFDQPETFPGRIARAARWRDLTGTRRPDKPWLDGLPRLIFLDDMGDTFTESLPLDWLAADLPVMAMSPHQWLILTKRPHRAAAFAAQYPFPPNVWLGTSLTGPASLPRLRALRQIQAALRFVSIEPLWAPLLALDLEGIAWGIVGGHSGDGWQEHPMPVAWVEAISDQFAAADVPLFVKQAAGPRPGQQGQLPDALWRLKQMPPVPVRVRP